MENPRFLLQYPIPRPRAKGDTPCSNPYMVNKRILTAPDSNPKMVDKRILTTQKSKFPKMVNKRIRAIRDEIRLKGVR